jgi:hypothetical protein
MLFFDAALGEIAGETEILTVRAASQAIVMRARATHHRHDQVADFNAAYLAADFDHFAERLVADDELVVAHWRGAVLESADFPVRATDAGLDHSKLYFRG